MIDSHQIEEHMEVIGSDGKRIGRVDHVQEEEIELAMLDLTAGLKHHMIRLEWVDHVEDNTVCLNLTKDATRARWRPKG